MRELALQKARAETAAQLKESEHTHQQQVADLENRLRQKRLEADALESQKEQLEREAQRLGSQRNEFRDTAEVFGTERDDLRALVNQLRTEGESAASSAKHGKLFGSLFRLFVRFRSVEVVLS